MFTLLSVVGLAIHLLGMWVGYDLLHINEWIVKIVLTVVVLIYNYISKRLFLFRKQKKDAAQPAAAEGEGVPSDGAAAEHTQKGRHAGIE